MSARPSAFVTPLLLLVSGACSMPQFEARGTVERTADAVGVARLACTTHNGAIALVGEPGRTEFHVRVEMSARGDTQEQADANLALLDVVVEREADLLRLAGSWPAELDSRASPSFAFTIAGPEALIAELLTHNGSIAVRGTRGKLTARTHNGQVVAEMQAAEVAVESHNGQVRLQLAGQGAVSGSVVTHNGAVEVALGERSAVVEASTHNGSIEAERADAAVSGSGRQRRIVVGDDVEGGASLRVETHNGSVRVR